MTKIGDTKTHLNWCWYQYQVWDGTWVNVAENQHPDEIDAETQTSFNALSKPELLYSDSDLLWAIEAADSLEELEEALRKNREHVDKPEDWDEIGEVQDRDE